VEAVVLCAFYPFAFVTSETVKLKVLVRDAHPWWW